MSERESRIRESIPSSMATMAAKVLVEELRDVMTNEQQWAIVDRHLKTLNDQYGAALALAKGAEERAQMLLQAKNEWADRAQEAESRIEAALSEIRELEEHDAMLSYAAAKLRKHLAGERS